MLVALGLCLVSAQSALAWRTQKLAPADGGLLAVSCVSPTFCMAVGSVEQAGQGTTLAEVYDGSAWSVVPTPNVPGATDNELLGVSCSSPTACTAVGFSQSLGVAQTLAEQWNGTLWSIQPTPLATASGLAAVSCTSATACTAVGGSGSFPDANGSALAESWNGTAWSIEQVPQTGRGSAEALRGVSCVSSTGCTAVGEQYRRGHGFFSAVVLRWSGGAWSKELSYGSAYADYAFNAVTCRTARRCVAVGQTAVASGVEYGIWARSKDGHWSTPRSNIVADNQELDGLSCTAPGACIAVGGVHEARAFAELWDGSSWTFDQVSTSTNMGLDAVSCTSRKSCVAVGVFQRDSGPTYPVVAVRR